MLRGPDALMAWAQRCTLGYPNVNVNNFTSAWRDGLAFAAIVHSQDPSALDFNSLTPEDPLKNLSLAFGAAERLGVPPLIDPEDVLVGSAPDRFCILTYLSQ